MQDNPAISWKKFTIFLLLLAFSFFTVHFLKSQNVILDQDEYRVSAVFDGDTIEVEKDGQKYTVRYLGIDTPELHKANTPVQCFAQEAYEDNKQMVEGKIIKLVKDIEDKDKYGRLLRYIWDGDKLINKELLSDGSAYIYEYNLDKLKFAPDFKLAMKSAIDQQLGLWSKCDSDSRVTKFEKEYEYVANNSNDSTIVTVSSLSSILGVSDISSTSTTTSTKTTITAQTFQTQSKTASISTATATKIQTVATTIMNQTSASNQQNIVVVSTTVPSQQQTLSRAECIGEPNIKGNVNVSTGTLIYHMFGQRYYEKTQIKEEEGDRWFCTEDEAIAAGFRKSKQ